MLEFAEEALDAVSLAIEIRRDKSLCLYVPTGRDVSTPASLGNKGDERPTVIAFVGDKRLCWCQPFDQLRGECLVGCLSLRDEETDRQAVLIDERVDLGTQSAMRTANGVIRTPFLPPAAC